MGWFVFLMTFNLLGNIMLSRDLFDPDSKDGSEFFTAMNGLMQWLTHPNVADLFSWLGRLELPGHGESYGESYRNCPEDGGEAG